MPFANAANVVNAQDREEGLRDIDEILNAANAHDREELRDIDERLDAANAHDGEEFRDIDEILNAANSHDGEELRDIHEILDMTNTADELSDMDEMLDGILLNDLGSSITEALHDGLGSRNVPTVASGVQAIVAAGDPTGATAAAPKRGRPKGSKDKQPRKKRQR